MKRKQLQGVDKQLLSMLCSPNTSEEYPALNMTYLNSPVLVGIYFQPFITWISSYFMLLSAEYVSHNGEVGMLEIQRGF